MTGSLYLHQRSFLVVNPKQPLKRFGKETFRVLNWLKLIKALFQIAGGHLFTKIRYSNYLKLNRG
jgi:hypothetical protein